MKLMTPAAVSVAFTFVACDLTAYMVGTATPPASTFVLKITPTPAGEMADPTQITIPTSTPRPTISPTPTQEPTWRITASPAPTATPVPSLTPMSTASSSPMATPVPTPTPSPPPPSRRVDLVNLEMASLWIALIDGGYGLVMVANPAFDVDTLESSVWVNGVDYCNTDRIYADEDLRQLSCQSLQVPHATSYNLSAQVGLLKDFRCERNSQSDQRRTIFACSWR